MPRQAGIYCRISSDPQGLKAGVERQEKDCRALAKKRGWKVAEAYIDNDVSAWSGKQRPEYQRLLEDIEAGAINALCVWHLDRLHRTPRELEEFIDVCARAGMNDVATVNGDFDVAESDGLFQARILTAVARKSSDDTSRRLRRKMEDIAREGRVGGGGKRAFGYERDGVTVNKEEARLIRQAAKRVLSGEGLITIVNDWIEQSIPTVSGGAWSTRSIKRTLLSPRVAGLREYKGVVVGPATWPAILDQETHEKLKAVLLNPDRSNGGNTVRKYLLPGYVFCGECDTRLVSRPQRRRGQETNKRSYACVSGSPYGGCGHVSVIAEPLEDLVRDAICEALDDGALATAIRAEAGEDESHRTVLAAIRDDEEALEQLAKDHYVERVISRAEFLQARRALEQRLDASKRRLKRTNGESVLEGLPKGSAALRKAWESKDLHWRRAVIGATIERVTVASIGKRRSYFDQSRISITWKV